MSYLFFDAHLEVEQPAILCGEFDQILVPANLVQNLVVGRSLEQGSEA
jgi:hypothetical protein